MNATPNHDATIETARRIFNAAGSTVADAEGAKTALDRVLAELDAGLEERRAAREEIMASSASAAELEKSIRRHDEVSTALQLKREIAASTAAKLDARISKDRAAAQEATRQARYQAAAARREKAFTALETGLGQMRSIARAMLRQLAEAEIEINAVNGALPAGAKPIHSVEAARRGRNIPPPSIEAIHFKRFFDEHNLRVGEEGDVRAEQATDGTWSVYPGPRGTVINGCRLVPLVRVITTRDGRIQPDPIAGALRIPGIFDGEAPGWEPMPHPHPAVVLAKLDELEAIGDFSVAPKVFERTVTLAEWEAQEARAAA